MSVKYFRNKKDALINVNTVSMLMFPCKMLAQFKFSARFILKRRAHAFLQITENKKAQHLSRLDRLWTVSSPDSK